MSFKPLDSTVFGGLDARTDPEDGGGALHALNVTFGNPSRGVLSTRPGLGADIGTVNFGGAITGALYSSTVGGIVGSGATVTVVNVGTGASLATNAALTTGSPWSFVPFGTGTTSCVYGTNGATSAGGLTKVTSAAVTQPTVTVDAVGARNSPRPITLAVQPGDNRLVAAGFNAAAVGPHGAASGASYVYFSEAGDAENWKTTNFVQLEPNDGETIQAAVAWNNKLFVFKQTKFFVFTGNSIDSSGNPVFNYYAVRAAFPNNFPIYQGFVTASEDGVYVITTNGIYRTTGGPPVIASPELTPAFQQHPPAAFIAGSISPSFTAIGSGGAVVWQNHLMFSLGQNYFLVRSPDGQWAVWLFTTDWAVIALVNGLTCYLPSASGGNGFNALGYSNTTDAGTVIPSLYASAYNTFGNPAVEKVVRRTELHGSGTVSLSWAKDLTGSYSTTQSVAMSSGRGWANDAVRGSVLSYRLSAASGAWTVDRLMPWVTEVRTGQ